MAWDKEDAAYFAKLADARRALEAGRLIDAGDWIVSSGRYWRYKDATRIKLAKEICERLAAFTEASVGENPWQREILSELYRIWPKVDLQGAILRHSFPEPHTDKAKVSGAEQLHLAKYSSGFISDRWGVLSRGRHWLKFWDLETGEVIRAEEQGLQMFASALGRDGSHVLFASSFRNTNTNQLSWTTDFRETFRRFDVCGRAYLATEPFEVRQYMIEGEVKGVTREKEVEVNREVFEQNPLKGKVLDSADYWRHHSPRYQEWIREAYSKEEAEEIFKENAAKEKREEQIVRVRLPQKMTIEHEEVPGYLPAGTTTFVAEDCLGGPELANLWLGRISATVNVVGDEAWLTNIFASGYGLKGMYNWTPTSPITSVCISSDGSLALRNGYEESFGMWNLWNGSLLRKFDGHTGRVTCLNLSVDVSFAVSGSEDKTVRLWKPITAECVRVFAGHEEVITQVSISVDATRIVSADRAGVIKVWDLDTGECLRTIQAHSANISGLHLMVSGKFAVSGSWDKTVKVWNLTDGSCLMTFEHDDWVTSVDMTPDGRYLLSSSYAGTKVWELIWRLDPCDGAAWNEPAQRYLEVLMNANAAWEGKLGTPIDMTEEEIRDTLKRGCPGWYAWHSPSKKNDWDKVWHLSWDIEETLGHAGYGWLSGAGDESRKHQAAWDRDHPPAESNQS